MVICLERGADLHMAQLMPLPLIVSCFSKIQIGFTFLVPAHPDSPGQRAVKRVCVCVCVTVCVDELPCITGLFCNSFSINFLKKSLRDFLFYSCRNGVSETVISAGLGGCIVYAAWSRIALSFCPSHRAAT